MGGAFTVFDSLMAAQQTVRGTGTKINRYKDAYKLYQR
jgi:hypothetical protein